MKEDIGEITRLTKTIESEVSHLTQNKIKIATERRNAIIDYNYELSQLKYHVQFQIISKSETWNEIISEYFKTLYPKYSYSESKFILFVEVQELKDKVKEINHTLIDVIKIDEVLAKLNELQLGQEIIYDDIEALKNLPNLKKKNFNEDVKGKIVDWGVTSYGFPSAQSSFDA